MRTQIEGFGLKDFFRVVGLPGWLLLAQPILFILLSRRRALNAYASVDASAVVFIIYAVICFYVGYKKIVESNTGFSKLILFKSPLIWLFIYTIVSFISSIWSVVPTLTAFRAFECLSMILIILACIQNLFEYNNPKLILVWSLLYATWEGIWAIIRTLRWTTDISILLESSQFFATTFFFIALYLAPQKWYNYLIILLSVFSMSTVAYIGMALGSVSSFWINNLKGKIIAYSMAFMLLLTIILMGPENLIKNTIFFDKDEVSLENTTGRDRLMNAALESISDHPMGLGFFAAEPYVLYAKHLGGISAHNSLFSAGMGLGYPGIILISMFFLSLCIALFSKHIDIRMKPYLIGCCCVAFLHCMGNPSVGSRVYAAWIPGVYIFILTCCFYVYGKYYDSLSDEESESD